MPPGVLLRTCSEQRNVDMQTSRIRALSDKHKLSNLTLVASSRDKVVVVVVVVVVVMGNVIFSKNLAVKSVWSGPAFTSTEEVAASFSSSVPEDDTNRVTSTAEH